MRSNGSAYVLIAGAVIVGYLGYQLWFNPARAVKRRLGEVAVALSIPADDTEIARITRLARLRRYLADDIHVRDEVTGRELTSRDAVLAIVATWTPPPPGVWDVSFVDVTITVESATEARSILTAEVFRIGWTAPGRYLERVRRLKFTNTMGTPAILQKTLAEFLRDGGYDHHLRSLRRAYHQQLSLFAQTMQRCFPDGTRYSRPQGGNVIWVEFPAKVDTLKLHHEALKHRINTAPGALFSVKNRYNNCLRMSCGLPWSDEIEAALKTLGDLIKKQL